MRKSAGLRKRSSARSRSGIRSLLPVRVSTAAAAPMPSARKFSAAPPSAAQGRPSHFRLPSMGKASMEWGVGGLPRPSTIGAGSKGPLKDPRPLSDRSYQMTLMKKLHSFLVETNYRGDVSMSIIKCPKSKDFLCMFQHAIGFLSPGEKISGKYDEQIPNLLKCLRYPFPVSAKALLSVGNPHTWSQMLGVFSWLIDLTRTMWSVGDEFFSGGFDDDDDANSPKHCEIEFDEIAHYYSMYMREELDIVGGELKEILQTKCEESCQEIDALCEEELAEIRALNEEEKSLANGPSLEKDVQLKETYLEDIRKFEEFIAQLEERIRGHDQKRLESSKKNKEIRELEVAEALEKKTQLEACLANQTMSAEEMKSLIERRSQLMAEWRSSKTQDEEQMRELERLQMKYSKVLAKVEQLTGQYNKEVLCLNLPPSAAHGSDAKERDLLLKVDLSSRSLNHSKEGVTRIRKAVIPALNSVQEDLMMATQHLKSKSLPVQESCERYESEIAARKHRKARSDMEADALKKEIQALEQDAAAAAQMSSDQFATMLKEKQALKSETLTVELQQHEEEVRQLRLSVEKQRASLFDEQKKEMEAASRTQSFLDETMKELEDLVCTGVEALLKEQENLVSVPTAAKLIQKTARK
ncbi:kinetochore protein NDC80 homolog [Oscarella lobularis]|uniref:kinetochore protein NDC80 homolog n=1 Tax=Oscarella lobularis TaxID=121494 RepID=UPI003313D3A8